MDMVFDGGVFDGAPPAYAPILKGLSPLDDLACAACQVPTGAESQQRRLEACEGKQRLYRAVFGHVSDAILLVDVAADGDFRLVALNPALEQLAGVRSELVSGLTIAAALPAALAERLTAQLRQCLHAAAVVRYEDSPELPGGPRHLQLTLIPMLSRGPTIRRIVAIGRDIGEPLSGEDRRCEAALQAREREFRTLAENSPDTIARYDTHCRRIYANQELVRAAGGHDRLLGSTPTEFPGGRNGQAYDAALRTVLATGENTSFELTWLTKQGEPRCSYIRLCAERDLSGAVKSVLAVGRDITEIDHYRQHIHSLAFFDTLTELPNRALFHDRFHQALADAAGDGHLLGLLFVDLDRFKAVNDSLGHAYGDLLLRETAARLKSVLRGNDTVARLGSDEFAIILPQIQDSHDVGVRARKILDAFRAPFLLAEHEHFASVSIGISIYPDDSTEGDELIKFADSAMHHAKAKGRDNFKFYSAELTASVMERLALEADLHKALSRQQLELYYQPKICLSSGRLLGSEALLRWNHPSRGQVPPNQFIPIAEETGMIVEIGAWVLRNAFETARQWNQSGGDYGEIHKVAVNLSARQFGGDELVKTVGLLLAETGCRAEWIELEITESLLLDDDGATRATLDAFRSMGFTIAIDDFGTGYSALSYLTRFPIHTLKIDRSFISSLIAERDSATLVRAIVSLAHSLRMTLVAEGVETEAQAAYLGSIGCHCGQGYLYSQPQARRQMEALLKAPLRDGSLAMRRGGIVQVPVFGFSCTFD